MIAQKELRKLFDYNEQSGVFTYAKKVNRCNIGDVVGYKRPDGYLNVMIRRKNYPVHRLAWIYTYGEEPNKIDHINHIRDDNRIENLRSVTTQENKKNSSLYSTNTSGVCGVSWCKQTSRWTSTIYVDDKSVRLGRFTEFSEAVNARKNAEVLYGFHTNHGKKDI